MATFSHRSLVPADAAAVFAWHERPEALLALAPARLWVRIEARHGTVRNGDRITFAVGLGPLRLRWEARHYGYVAGRQFCDEQVRGPFRLWRHTHRVHALTAHTCVYEDEVDYCVRGGPLVERLLHPVVRIMLARMFATRHRIVREVFAAERDDRLRRVMAGRLPAPQLRSA